jgi:hypothetical protein
MYGAMKKILTCIVFIVVLSGFASTLRAEGWISPTSNYPVPKTPNNSAWTDPQYAYDSPLAPNLLYASCSNSGGAQEGAKLVLYRSSSFRCKYIRLNTDFDTAYISSVNIAVGNFDGSTFTSSYTFTPATSLNNGTYSELACDDFYTINAIQISYNFKINVGFWLYEVGFYESPATISAPTIATLDATSVKSTSANLHGHIVSTGGEPCTTWFEYGTTTSYGATTTQVSGYLNDQTCGAHLTGLSANTTYHYRAVAFNSANSSGPYSYGSDVIFTTPDTGAPLSGWVSPDSASYSTSIPWTALPYTYDDEGLSGAEYYHTPGSGTTVRYLYLTLDSSLLVDKIRFMAKKISDITNIRVDLRRAGTNTWDQRYNATFVDASWGTVWNESATIATPRAVTEARITFTTTDNGFTLMLYEFDFHVYNSASPGVDESCNAFIDGAFAGSKK